MALLPGTRGRLCLPKSGFTLIELLVVVSIISLLLAVMLSGLQSARRLARRVRCASNLRSLTYAALMYAGDNDEYLLVKDEGMNPYQLDLGWQREIAMGHPDLRNMFQGYLGGFEKKHGPSPTMFCPSARRQYDQQRRRFSFDSGSARWEQGHYVLGYSYWAAVEDNLDALELDWFSDMDPPRRTTDKSYTPLFSDPVEKHHSSPSPYPWGVASHTRSQGTAEFTSADPVGQNNARLDGSVDFLRFSENREWVDEDGLNHFGDLEAATCLLEDKDVLLLWGRVR
jgi:prepilin-type N-terminal cleavage/methylation domain-containing protein